MPGPRPWRRAPGQAPPGRRVATGAEDAYEPEMSEPGSDSPDGAPTGAPAGPPRDIDAIPEQAQNWLRAGRKVALATVIRTWGSAPRPAGSQLAIAEGGLMAGSVSGGCVEGAVVEEALEALRDGRPRRLEYGVSDEDAFAVGLACGGTIEVLVEPVGIGLGPGPDELQALVRARAQRRPLAWQVNLQSWERRLAPPPGAADAALQARFDADSSGLDGPWLSVIHNPPPRLIAVGAVHIAQALLPMARIAGHDVLLVDPRAAFASARRFPGETILDEWPDEALERIGLDARSAVVTLTHDPKLDDPAIRAALASPVYYLGCLGSKRTHAKRLERLRAAGLREEALARIHAPVGADIGARSPAEIAVAILAEITEALRRPGGRPAPPPL